MKQTLATLAHPAARPVVNLVLDAKPVHSHLNETAAAVVGRSLRNENSDLFKAVQRLFTTRNKIAHGSPEQPGKDALREAVETAEALFGWLQSLSTSATAKPTD